MLVDELRKAQERVNELERQIQSCRHEFGEPYPNPETYRKGNIVGYRPRGSDPEPIMSYYDATRARWTRKCKKCGKEDHTYNTKPATYAPDFDNKSGPPREF